MSTQKQLNFELSPKPPLISQWFTSLEGEGRAIGEVSIYIRLAGCYSAACAFCDTKFSWGEAPNFKEIGDKDISTEIGNQSKNSSPRRLTITGGEPLHFMNYFPRIFGWINSINSDKLEFFGIESNGNILKDQENCMHLIKSFNHIISEFNVTPALTISPKLDAKSCYENQLSQQKVDSMYFDVFDNINNYLKQYPIYFKFIYDFTNEFVDFDHQKKFIDYLLNDLNVTRKNIMLMPFTPDDPLGADKSFWEKSKDATSRKALELGVTYSPRIHIDRKLD
jgi:organic radical activating enzyme